MGAGHQQTALPGVPVERAAPAGVQAPGRGRHRLAQSVAGVGVALQARAFRRARTRSIRNHRAAIEAALTYGLTNARVESVNTKIRLLQRVAFGYRDPEALIAMAMLDLGGCCPYLPATPQPELEPTQDLGGLTPRTP